MFSSISSFLRTDILSFFVQPGAPFQRQNSSSALEEEANRRKRPKRTMQQEHAVADVYTQSIDQDSQEKPLDVEEIEVQQTLHEDKILDVEGNHSNIRKDEPSVESTQSVEENVNVDTMNITHEVEEVKTHEEADSPARNEGFDTAESTSLEKPDETANLESHEEELTSLKEKEDLEISKPLTSVIKSSRTGSCLHMFPCSIIMIFDLLCRKSDILY